MVYTLTSGALASDAQTVIRSDGAVIPPDPANRDFAAYLAWLAEGNTPTPYTPPPASIPQEVSRRQFLQAAAMQGVITEIEAEALVVGVEIPARVASAIATLPEEQCFPARMLIKGAATFVRSHPILPAFATAMGKSSTDLDALFALADTL